MAVKMWAGRTAGATDKLADDFNSSISFDCRMYKQDIMGSMAHAAMLGKQGIISQSEAEQLIEGVKDVSANAVEESLSRRNVDWSTMKSSVKSTVARYIYEQTKRNPMILPIIEEI